jgi:hypothetical protein
MILSILKRLLGLLRPKLFLTESAAIKKTDINSFLIIYIRSKASKFTGSTLKQDNNNNNQTQAFSMLRAETSKTPVSTPRIVPV